MRAHHPHARVVAALLATVALAVTFYGGTASAPAKMRVNVVSNRADLISGGNALVSINRPRRLKRHRAHVILKWTRHGKRHHRNVSKRFRKRANGRYEAFVTKLPLGGSILKVRVGPKRANARIVNHRNGGPVLSGPQVKPWVCQAGAKDKRCNQPKAFQYFYASSNPLTPKLQAYDPAAPPADVANTTTDQGVTVPFIIRVETGYADRDQYKIAALWQPGKPWKAWASQEQFNHKLLVTHGAGCGADYGAATAPDVFGPLQPGIPGVDDAAAAGSDDVGKIALGRGFAVGSTALDNNSHNCNIAVQAESLIMLKEHLIERYGRLRYTIAAGCSGGSVVQQQVANAYPGIYQGLTPQCSYPDTFSPGTQFADFHMLRLYFEDPSQWGPGIVWLPTQMGDVDGHLSHVDAITADEGLFKGAITPTGPCDGVTPEQTYNPDTNPDGVRCDILSYMKNVLGPRPRKRWTAIERQIGHSFAGMPFGNIGVQYGLGQLMNGGITPAQFADLNAKVGGLSIVDLHHTNSRLHENVSALRNAYRSGAFDEANNLDRVATINLGGPDPGAAHDYAHAFFMRARLEREQKHDLRNYVMWFGSTPILGSLNFRGEALLAMDRWLTAVEKDKRKRSLASKIATDRPADIQDRCEIIPGIPSPGVCEIPLAQTKFGTPRKVAGDSIASDTGACKLKPLKRSDYYPITFTNAEWAQVESAFPKGVCNWAKRGRGKQGTIPWLTYQKRSGKVIYGGKRLGKAPQRSGFGWTSKTFRSWRAAKKG